MKPSLQLRQSQHLALTPQLQQSIRLLQLSTLELQQEVQQMLDANPLLEVEGDDFEPGVSQLNPPELRRDEAETNNLANTSEGGSDTGNDTSGDGDGERELRADDFGTTAQDDWANGTEGDDFDGIREQPSLKSGAEGSGDDDTGNDFDTPQPTLPEHLREQLVGMSLSQTDRLSVLLLIDSLDDDGYLADPLDELALQLAGDDAEALEALTAQLRIALALLHSMDPPGVGARSLGECLCLQLRDSTDPLAPLSRTVCAQYLEYVARRDWRRLGVLTQASEAELKAAAVCIARLEPKPGRRFARSDNTPVIPDVIVVRRQRQWRAEINPDVLPKLRVNEMYARALKQVKGAISGSPLGGQLQEARWFIKNIQQRFDTIQRVSQAIVERQSGFFNHGELAMRPLVLREIADELGLHESTISRVTTAKFMATPHGTFELKYFFGSGLHTETGGEASSTAVRALIRQFIDAENKKKPLSDNQLATMLEEQGIQCARRTVAKYREGMKIPTGPLRKEG